MTDTKTPKGEVFEPAKADRRRFSTAHKRRFLMRPPPSATGTSLVALHQEGPPRDRGSSRARD